MKRHNVVITFLLVTLTVGSWLNVLLDSAEGVPSDPDWSAVISETRTRLGPVRPMQSCVDYSQEALAVCGKHGLDCFPVSFACSETGHSVVIGRYSANGQRWCRILDPTNRSQPDDRPFPCEKLLVGSIQLNPVYCDGKSDCRCAILKQDQVYKSSDPGSAAAIYRPTGLRSLFGARALCLASCQEQRREHDQELAVIESGCNGQLLLNKQSVVWGLESWLVTMSHDDMCRYSSRYAREADRFHEACIDSCNSFGRAT